MIQLLSSGHVTLNTEGQALIASAMNSQLTVTSIRLTLTSSQLTVTSVQLAVTSVQLLVSSFQFTVTGNAKIYSCISS